MCKLTDFDSRPLQANLNLVVKRILELQRHRDVGMKTCEEMDMVYAEVFPNLDAEYNDMCLWRVKLLEAIGKVGIREMIASN